MILFDNIQYERFFNPLCCKNRRIYYECIMQLIEKSKTVPVLYEADARDTLILYFRNCRYSVLDDDVSADEEESISDEKSDVENASAILRYFRHCGWLSERELGRSGDNIASVVPHCRKMIEALEKIFNRDSSASLTNHIFSIYDILHSAFTPDHGRTYRPYSNILVPVADSVSDLKNELQVLRDSIQSIMRMIIQMTESNQLGQFLLKDEMMKTFFSDYFFIKKDGLIPGYIEEIEKMLRRISGTDVYKNMTAEYMSLYNTDEYRAREIIEGQFSEVRNFISYEYIRTMDHIDKKINSYYNLYSTRILMVMSSSVNMQAYLNDLLMKMRNASPEERSQILQAISACFGMRSHRYIGRRSIQRRKKSRPNTRSGAVITDGITDTERKRLTDELLNDSSDSYSISRAAEYYDSLLAEKDSIVPDAETVRTRDDAMMTAAGIIYSGSDEFPYEIEFLGGTVDTEAAVISNIKVKRKS